jgi:hypothetical protein
MHIRNTMIFVAMAAIYGLVVGFAYGNLFEAKYGFQLKDWQPLVGVLVAVTAAMLTYIGVRGTQRINVVIKEQDRLDASLPGLRQVNELLIIIRGPLSALPTKRLYQTAVVLDSAIRVAPTESVETAVRRQLPLADDHLKWEVAEILFSLRSQAALVKIGQEEVERYRRDLANIHTFAPTEHNGLRDIAKQVEASHNRENEQMRRLVVSLDAFADVVKERIAKAERRQKIIRGIIDKFFKED